MSNVPEAYLCSLTKTVMTDPYKDSEGNSYEHTAIIEYLKSHSISPVTNNPLSERDLVPNNFLKNILQNYKKNQNKNNSTIPTPHIHNSSSIFTRTVNTAKATILQQKLALLKSPTEFDASQILERKPLMIYTVIDVSGSMDSSCGGSNGNAEADLYSRLDLVKHTLKTIIHSLSDHDKICVIKFSDTAEVVIPLAYTLASNKDILLELVEDLKTEGSTNIYDSLKVSFDELSLSFNDNYSTEIYLLTDGESNINPPGDIVETLKNHILTKSNSELLMEKVTVNTFGYGYSLDSELLYRLCKVGKGGIFGFLPDSSMVGTVFINALSNSLTSSSLDGQVYSNFNIYDVVLPKFVSLLETLTKSDQNVLHSLIADFLSFANDLKLTLETSEEDLKTKTFLEDLFVDCTDTGDVNTGQVVKACDANFYNKWGKHYLRSIRSAFEKRVCSNFKDKSMQTFKSDLFVVEQKRIEEVFIDLPPPKPSRTYAYNGGPAATTMAGYYNAAGGCFSSDSIVCRVIDGEVVPIAMKDLCKGMSVLSTDGSVDEVECVVKLRFQGSVYAVGSVSLTPYHPILMNNSNSYFPCELGSQSFEVNDYVYDMVLVNRGLVACYYDYNIQTNIPVVNFQEYFLAATFGHNCSLKKFSHEYFGSERVVSDLKKHHDYYKGFIIINDYNYNRNTTTGIVEKMVFSEYIQV